MYTGTEIIGDFVRIHLQKKWVTDQLLAHFSGTCFARMEDYHLFRWGQTVATCETCGAFESILHKLVEIALFVYSWILAAQTRALPTTPTPSCTQLVIASSSRSSVSKRLDYPYQTFARAPVCIPS